MMECMPKGLVFSCLVELQNDLSIIGLLVASDCVHCEVFKFTN